MGDESGAGMRIENALIIDTSNLAGRDLEVKCSWKAVRFPLLKELASGRQLFFPRPVELSLAIKAEQDLVRASGRMVTAVQLDCSRCLEKFDLLIDQSLELVYQPAASAVEPEEDEVELTAEQIELIAFEDSKIDLRQAVAEQVILAIPIKPLCSPQCKGLCPHCGMNLNLGPCHCPARRPTGPFAGLKVLLDGGGSD